MSKRGYSDRAPFDGRPYYCLTCGLGYGEYIACEEPGCELESEDVARARQRRASACKSEDKT